MEHKTFRIVSLISFIVILINGVLYNYYITTESTELIYRFILKPIPISILVIDTVIYFFIYRMHIYALLIQMSFLFCLLGDILLMFYIPSIPEYNNKIFLIVGGTSFFIARVIMTLAFGVYPYRNKIEKCLTTTVKKTVLTAIIPFIYTVYIIIWFANYMKNTIMMVLLSFYIVIMGIQLFLSLLRIKGFVEESIVPQLFGFLGTCLFTVSDTLLFWNIFLIPIRYADVISISLYWSGMYLLMISIVRNSKFNYERSNIPTYLPLS